MPSGFTPTTATWGFHIADFSGIGSGIAAIDADVGGNAPHFSQARIPATAYDIAVAYTTVSTIVSLFAESYSVTLHLTAVGAEVNIVETLDKGVFQCFTISGLYTLVVWTKSSRPLPTFSRGATRLKMKPVTRPDGTVIPVNELFDPTGGTALVGGSPITFTSVVGDELLGIPASGPGSIGCDVNVDDEVGPGSNGNGCEPGGPGSTTLNVSPATTHDVPKGTEINIWIQRDDLVSQAEFGIRERLIEDTSLMSQTLAAERGDAELDLFSQPIITVSYSTRNPTKVGKLIDINLTNPPLVGNFAVQDVTISQIDEKPNPTGIEREQLAPLYQVRASSVKFTLDDLLRRVRL
jgi:hypothetical protein